MDTYPVVTSAVIVTSQRQVRFTVTNTAANDGRILVYDYRIGAWFEWQLKDAVGSTVVPIGGAFIDSIYYIANAVDDKVWQEDTSTWFDDTTVWITMMVQTGAIQPAGPMSWMGVWELGVMAEYKDDHQLNVGIYNDHNESVTQLKAWTDAQLQALTDEADRMHLLIKPTYPKVESVSVRIFDSNNGSPSTGQGFEIHGLAVELSLPGGLPRLEKQARQ
jgi:hypothetical protein